MAEQHIRGKHSCTLVGDRAMSMLRNDLHSSPFQISLYRVYSNLRRPKTKRHDRMTRISAYLSRAPYSSSNSLPMSKWPQLRSHQ